MERVTDDKGRTFTKQVDIMNAQRLFFLIFIKKKIDKEGMEEKRTTFMGNTTTPTISATQKEKWVILLKTGPKCDIEGKNSSCEIFNVIIWK